MEMRDAQGGVAHSAVIHVRLPGELEARARARAESRLANVSEYVRELIRRDVLEAA